LLKEGGGGVFSLILSKIVFLNQVGKREISMANRRKRLLFCGLSLRRRFAPRHTPDCKMSLTDHLIKQDWLPCFPLFSGCICSLSLCWKTQLPFVNRVLVAFQSLALVGASVSRGIPPWLPRFLQILDIALHLGKIFVAK
jgi:hypothetical protein